MVCNKETLLEVSTQVATLYSLMKQKNSDCGDTFGVPSEIEQGINFLRSQSEEYYKQLIAPVVCYFLTRLVNENDKKPLQRKDLGTFYAPNPPEVSITDYMARIVKYTPCSAECYLLSLIFIDRVAEKQQYRVNSYNVHRLLLTTMVISAKLLDDTTVNNKYYSHVGGIPIKELNNLECKLLSLLNYDLNVSFGCFELYRYQLELQLIRQLHSQNEDSVYTVQEMSKWEEPPVAKTPEEIAYLRNKRLRRSRSFNSPPVLPSHTFRKGRSTSFTILGLPVDSFG